MYLFFLIGTGIYFFFIVLIFSGLLFKRTYLHTLSDLPMISVIIAARNEQENIQNILEDLVNQNMDKNSFEIIIANDRSTDDTSDIINDYSKTYNNIKIIDIENINVMTPKKYALTKAIEKSNGDIIISTDADCRVNENWVNSMAQLVNNTDKIVIGYSKINNTNSLLKQYQNIDFLGIMSANAGLLNLNIICSGSGQNLAYKKKHFLDINGFVPVQHLISGDDMYLVQSISKLKGAIFNYDPNSFVSTTPKNKVIEYLNQRTRWSSNSKNIIINAPYFFIFLFSALITNCGILYGLYIESITITLIILIKLCVEGLIIYIGGKIFETKTNFLSYIFWNITQPIYIPIITISGLIGKYSWKK